MSIIDTIRKHEPKWLAEKRKALIGPLPGALVALLLHYGVKVNSMESDLIGLVVVSFFTWLIPNQPPDVTPDGVKWG